MVFGKDNINVLRNNISSVLDRCCQPLQLIVESIQKWHQLKPEEQIPQQQPNCPKLMCPLRQQQNSYKK
jgi:hypothetical protein